MLPCVHSIWYLSFEEKKIVGLKGRKKETPVNLRVADQEMSIFGGLRTRVVYSKCN